LAFPEPNLKLSDAQPFFCFKISNPNLDKRDIFARPQDSAGQSAANFSSRFQIFRLQFFYLEAIEQLESQLRRAG
jgi:hypothetical protein